MVGCRGLPAVRGAVMSAILPPLFLGEFPSAPLIIIILLVDSL